MEGSSLERNASAHAAPGQSDVSKEEITNHLSAVDIERQQLQSELQRAVSSDVVNNLKARINALAPGCRSPPEILCYIFSLLDRPAALEYSLLMAPQAWKNHMVKLGWLVVTHVCRRWRCVAVENPILWSHITFALGSQWADFMLSRSMQVPVSINAIMENHNFGVEDAARIVHHLPHVKVLKMMAETEICSDALKPCLHALVAPAPVLEVLELKDSNDFNIIFPEELTWVPLNIFASHSPRLRDISLTDVFIPWTLAPTLFKNVHDLHLSCTFTLRWQGHDQYWLPTLTQFLDVLEAAVDLHSLSVDGLMPSADEYRGVVVSDAIPRSLTHRRIVTLTLEGDMHSIALVLSCLDTPSNTLLTMFVTGYHGGLEEEAHVFFLALSRHLSSRRNTSSSSVDNLCIKQKTSTLRISCDLKTGESTKLQVLMVFEGYVDITSIFVRQFFIKPPFGPIHVIQSIALGSTLFEQLAPSLGLTTDTDDEVSQLPAAVIYALEIFEYTFTGATWTTFLEALQARKICGCPLRSVTFRRCSMSNSDWMPELLEVVEETVALFDRTGFSNGRWSGRSSYPR